MSFFFTGQSLGLLLGFFLGSRLEQAVGWRMSFFFAGLPGIVLAIFLLLRVREPARSISSEPIGLRAGLRCLAGYKTLRRLAVAVVLGTLTASALMSWGASYLIRLHGMSVADVGTALGLAYGIGGAIGVFAIGLLADRLVVRDLRWYLWLPAIVTAIIVPLVCAALTASSGTTATLFLLFPCAFGSTFTGVVYSVLNMIAPAQFRATTTALFVIIMSIFGTGLGTWLIGIASDLLAPMSETASIKYALLAIVPGAAILAAIQYVRAAQTLRADLASARAAGGMAALA
jgi:predicted MFS family arabinose efflux permease